MSDERTIKANTPADFTPQLGDYKALQPFRYWCQKVLPLVYDESLSYYELLCKVVDYLNKTMEDVSNMNTDITNIYAAYTKLQDAFNELVGYVNNYFDNLDVQDEINKKLDEMASNGTLSEIFSEFSNLPYWINAYAKKIDDATDIMNENQDRTLYIPKDVMTYINLSQLENISNLKCTGEGHLITSKGDEQVLHSHEYNIFNKNNPFERFVRGYSDIDNHLKWGHQRYCGWLWNEGMNLGEQSDKYTYIAPWGQVGFNFEYSGELPTTIHITVGNLRVWVFNKLTNSIELCDATGFEDGNLYEYYVGGDESIHGVDFERNGKSTLQPNYITFTISSQQIQTSVLHFYCGTSSTLYSIKNNKNYLWLAYSFDCVSDAPNGMLWCNGGCDLKGSDVIQEIGGSISVLMKKNIPSKVFFTNIDPSDQSYINVFNMVNSEYFAGINTLNKMIYPLSQVSYSQDFTITLQLHQICLLLVKNSDNGLFQGYLLMCGTKGITAMSVFNHLGSENELLTKEINGNSITIKSSNNTYILSTCIIL